MIDSVLVRHNVSLRLKITVKTLVSLAIVALAVLLPQLVHLAAGAQGGMQWLPMYLPVLLGGCLLGWQWGLGVGILSPVVSFALTTLTGNPMPVALRLPYMMAELAVFAAFLGRSQKTAGWLSLPYCSHRFREGLRFSSLPRSFRACPRFPQQRFGRRSRRACSAWSLRLSSFPSSSWDCVACS